MYIKPLYYAPNFALDCILVFFNLVFKIYFNRFPKEFALKVVISISLKCIDSNLTIVVITYRDF